MQPWGKIPECQLQLCVPKIYPIDGRDGHVSCHSKQSKKGKRGKKKYQSPLQLLGVHIIGMYTNLCIFTFWHILFAVLFQVQPYTLQSQIAYIFSNTMPNNPSLSCTAGTYSSQTLYTFHICWYVWPMNPFGCVSWISVRP